MTDFLRTLATGVIQRSPIIEHELNDVDDIVSLAIQLTAATSLEELCTLLGFEVREAFPLSVHAQVTTDSERWTIIPNSREVMRSERWCIAYGLGLGLIVSANGLPITGPGSIERMVEMKALARSFATALLKVLDA